MSPSLCISSLRTVLALCLVSALSSCGGGEPAPDPAEAAAAPRQEAAAVGPLFDVVFARETDGAADLFAMSWGETPVRLTTTPYAEIFPSWIPGTDQVLFVVDGEGIESGAYRLDVATGAVEMAIAGLREGASPSPDGRHAFVTLPAGDGTALTLVDLASGERRTLPSSGESPGFGTWSPSGDFLVFEGSFAGSPEIFRADLDGGNAIRLTDNPALDEWPAASPDGSRIAWAAGSEEDKNLWLMNADGSGKRQLSHGLLFGDAYPAWSPDGRRILLTAATADDTSSAGVGIYEIIIESGQTRRVLDGMMPSWRSRPSASLPREPRHWLERVSLSRTRLQTAHGIEHDVRLTVMPTERKAGIRALEVTFPDGREVVIERQVRQLSSDHEHDAGLRQDPELGAVWLYQNIGLHDLAAYPVGDTTLIVHHADGVSDPLTVPFRDPLPGSGDLPTPQILQPADGASIRGSVRVEIAPVALDAAVFLGREPRPNEPESEDFAEEAGAIIAAGKTSTEDLTLSAGRWGGDVSVGVASQGTARGVTWDVSSSSATEIEIEVERQNPQDD